MTSAFTPKLEPTARDSAVPYCRTSVRGFRLPNEHGPTASEIRWIQLLRDLTDDGDPPVPFEAAHVLRQLLIKR